MHNELYNLREINAFIFNQVFDKKYSTFHNHSLVAINIETSKDQEVLIYLTFFARKIERLVHELSSA